MELIARHANASVSAATTCRTVQLLAAEARPAVQAVFLLRFASMALLAPDPSPSIALGATGWLLVTVAIYLLNGISDLAGDKVNGSSRPLAAGVVDVATARFGATACSLTGVATCCVLSPLLGSLSIAILMMGLGYSFGPCWKDGRYAASIVIGAGAALTYIAGAAVAGVASWQLMAFTISLSAWIGLASASKDFSDVSGDRMAGRRTIPVELGFDMASRHLALTTASAAAIVMFVSIALGVHTITTGVTIAGTAVLAFVLAAARKDEFQFQGRTPYRVYMVTQYAACAGLLAGALP